MSVQLAAAPPLPDQLALFGSGLPRANYPCTCGRAGQEAHYASTGGFVTHLHLDCDACGRSWQEHHILETPQPGSIVGARRWPIA